MLSQTLKLKHIKTRFNLSDIETFESVFCQSLFFFFFSYNYISFEIIANSLNTGLAFNFQKNLQLLLDFDVNDFKKLAALNLRNVI